MPDIKASATGLGSNGAASTISVQLYHDICSLWGSRFIPNSPPPLHRSIVLAAIAKFSKSYENSELLLAMVEQFLLPMTRAGFQMEKSLAGLLWGPPGTGKTVMARTLLPECGFRPIWYGAAPELSSRWIGETETKIQELFARCHETPGVPCFIAIDEIDTLTGKRSLHGNEAKTDWLSLLLRLVGSDEYPNLIVIGCTNRKHAMDLAYLRRNGSMFYCGRLSVEARRNLFRVAAKKCGLIIPENLDVSCNAVHRSLRGCDVVLIWRMVWFFSCLFCSAYSI